MTPSWIVLGLMEIGSGLLFMRHQDAFVTRLQQSRRPLPTSDERDRRATAMLGPFVIFIGIVTILAGSA